MVRLGSHGSIIMVSSFCGHLALEVHTSRFFTLCDFLLTASRIAAYLAEHGVSFVEKCGASARTEHGMRARIMRNSRKLG